MMASIDDVAAHVVSHFDGPISTMKLQKLCYMSQGWSLALLGHELFSEEFEAWKNGPVSRRLFAQHRREFSVDSWPSGKAERLESRERALVDAVLENYGGLSGLQLGELTHRAGTPWTMTREQHGVAEGDSSTVVIPKDRIEAHYKSRLSRSSGA